MRVLRFVLPNLRRAGLAAVLALGASDMASAQTEIIDSAFSACTATECDTTSIAGWVGSAGGRVLPWTAKFLAEAGNCLRLRVDFTGNGNLEMTVVAPDGRTRYRNDNQGGGGSCTNCPLVKISPTPHSGFYTVVLSTATGAPVDTDFHLLFGQYTPGNPNCQAPTPPLP